ncbi:MAG: ribosomal protein S18-alanine N-acetyltransferase [Nitrospirae bacterium]|jgi:ribosomal-protein-alanine N-acetyltransferase|nr:ribosomal protein S18-alanine N-acetyltransferase [Nitrospirota bacterium]MCL5259239.1 ribosomal protein S18-alanine N-acetyltransferase [Nitrospirota bacterium]
MEELPSETPIDPREFRIVRLGVDPWPEVLRRFFDRQDEEDRSGYFLGEALLSELKWVDVAEYYGLFRPKGPGLVGFLGAWFVDGEAEIHHIFLDPSWRRKGLGKAFLRRFMEYAAKRRVVSLYLEVRRSSHIARSLYRRLGFVETGERKNYYSCPLEDAILMGCRLPEERAAPSADGVSLTMEGSLHEGFDAGKSLRTGEPRILR